jgi:hypothetical protein
MRKVERHQGEQCCRATAGKNLSSRSFIGGGIDSKNEEKGSEDDRLEGDEQAADRFLNP